MAEKLHFLQRKEPKTKNVNDLRGVYGHKKRQRTEKQKIRMFDKSYYVKQEKGERF